MITGKISLDLKPSFGRKDLHELAEERDGPHLTLYMPLHRTGREVRQSPILLKDMRNRAVVELDRAGASLADREAILAPVNRLLEETDLSVLQGEGLVIFSAQGSYQAFLLPVRPPEMAVVDRRFRIDPLLPQLYENGRFHVLTLSLNDVGLWEVDRKGIRPIPLAGLAVNMREALHFEDSESYLLFHTESPSIGGGMRPPMYYGTGGGKRDLKEMKRDILRFFQQIDLGIRERLPDPEIPMMLAGVDYLQPIYREASDIPRLLGESLSGNPDSFGGPEGLRARAWEKYMVWRRRDRIEVIQKYRELLATDKTAAGITDVLPTASQGRVSHLFIRKGYSQWGEFDPATGRVVPLPSTRPGAEDLVASASAYTLLGDGKVYVLEPGEMPPEADIASLCRY